MSKRGVVHPSGEERCRLDMEPRKSKENKSKDISMLRSVNKWNERKKEKEKKKKKKIQ